MSSENVILVDSKDQLIGTMEKMEAHRKGLLHRAFSIYLFNDKNELLLQKRADHKYHSGGLWTNTCCGHPRPQEDIHDAAIRRLMEEMGLDSEFTESCVFSYKAELDKGMTEHEYLHVFVGKVTALPKINPDEVSDWKFIPIDYLLDDFQKVPHQYTEWFKITLPLIQNQESKLV